MNLQAGKNRLKGKTRHQRVPVSCALLAARGSQIPPQLAISGRLLCSSSAKQQISPSMFPTLRKPVHCSKHNPPLAELPSFTLGLDLLTSCIVYTRCPFCLSTNQHLEGKPAASLLLPCLPSVQSNSDLCMVYTRAILVFPLALKECIQRQKL